MRLTTAVLVLLISLVTITFASDDVLTIWRMDGDIFNEVGGGYNQFAKSPSKATLHAVNDVYRGSGGRSLRIDYDKQPDGFCGAWVHLFDFETPANERVFVDTEMYPYVSFWVKGAKGGEQFNVQMADPEWLAMEDSVSAGPVEAYLPDGVTTEWQEVVVPFDDFGLSEYKAAVFTLNFTEQGSGSVYIDDLTFKKTPDAEVAFTDAPKYEDQEINPDLVRVMWVWHTKTIAPDPEQVKELIDFSNAHKINEFFLQVVYHFDTDDDGKTIVVIEDQEHLENLIKECTKNGIKIHALDGYPEFALTEFHHKPLAFVQAIIDYNNTVDKDAQFYGVHLDNEPYQIMGFDGPARESILTQYLELNQKIMDLIKSEGSDMVYGPDIPMWWDEAVPPTVATFNGVRKDVAKHTIDIVDNVGIMDYRDFAGGVDGIVKHGQGEIDYADKVGKKVYIGVETFKYVPMDIVFVYGPPEDVWQQALADDENMFYTSTVKDFKVRAISSGGRRYLGIARPENMKDPKVFDEALIELYNRFGATTGGREADLFDISLDAANAIQTNPEYEGFEEFTIKDDDGNVKAMGFKTTEYMLGKITFAEESKAELEEVFKEVAEAYADNPSFIGFAIHFYKTYRDLPDE